MNGVVDEWSEWINLWRVDLNVTDWYWTRGGGRVYYY
jgi:hypothetical protein